MTEEVKPHSDPTRATLDFVDREVAGVRAITDVRIAAVEKAIEVFNENLNRVPTTLDREINRLRDLVTEKFSSIQLQFSERDHRTAMVQENATVAVSAALQAQKEAAIAQNESNLAAVKKSDDATAKQIDAINQLMGAKFNSIESRQAEMMAQQTRLDSAAAARASAQSNGLALAVGCAVIIGTVTAVLLAFRPSAREVPQPSYPYQQPYGGPRDALTFPPNSPVTITPAK